MPLEISYTKEKLRPGDGIAIPQGDWYSIEWEADSVFSILEHLKLYHDPVPLENTNRWDAVNQESVDRKLPQAYNIDSEWIAEAPHCDTHFSQDDVNTPEMNKRKPTEAAMKNVDTTISRHDLNIRCFAESTATTQTNVPTEQTDEAI